MRYAYTPEQNAWLRERYPTMTNRELAAAFEERFGEPTTKGAMNSWGNNHHVRKEPWVRSQASRKYTDEQLDFLREVIPGRSLTQVNDLYEGRFGERLTRPALANLRAKLGVYCGVNAGRFRKGQEPPNKGKTWDEYLPPEMQERCRATTFKPGTLSGIAKERDHGRLGIRTTKGGYREIRIDPRGVKHTMERWIPLGAFEWMVANGREWPEGCKCAHIDRDLSNDEPDNIVPVPTELWPLVCGAVKGQVPWHDRETLEVALTAARITRKRRELELRRRAVEGHPWAQDREKGRNDGSD